MVGPRGAGLLGRTATRLWWGRRLGGEKKKEEEKKS